MKSAVLFLVFNRPNVTQQVFDAIRSAKPPRLYVAADGPRPTKIGEAERTTEVRRIATDVDWPCEVITLFQKKNLGCKQAVSRAITWFFEKEEQGIILEDDCLPAPSFFDFCDEMLDRYKSDTRVWQVSGSTFFSDAITKTDADYFFTRYGPIWGWASWRRAWHHYDANLLHWSEMSSPAMMKNVYPHDLERAAKLQLGGKLYKGEIDTWDYQWGFSKNYNNALTIVPKKNQIVNIGFGEDATHTFGIDANAPKEFLALESTINHPLFVIEDVAYGASYAQVAFGKKRGIRQSLKNLLNTFQEHK